jgi:hypothetical protein
MNLSNLDSHLVAATLLFFAVRVPTSLQTPITTPKLYNTTAGLEIAYEQVTCATPKRVYRHEDVYSNVYRRSPSCDAGKLDLQAIRRTSTSGARYH